MDRSIDTQQPARSWHDLHQNLISSCAWQLSCLQRLAGGSTKKLHTLQIWFHSLFLIPPSCASEDRKKNEIFEWKITNNTFLGRPYPFENNQWWSCVHVRHKTEAESSSTVINVVLMHNRATSPPNIQLNLSLHFVFFTWVGVFSGIVPSWGSTMTGDK